MTNRKSDAGPVRVDFILRNPVLAPLVFQPAVVTAMTSTEECIHWLYFGRLFVRILAGMPLYDFLQDFRSFSTNIQFWFAFVTVIRKSTNYLKPAFLPKPEKDLVMMEFISNC